MLLFPNALCCSLYERNCVCAVTKIVTKFLPADNFCQLLRVTRKRSCTSAGNAQAQLHLRDDQQRAFGISNISNSTVHFVFFLNQLVKHRAVYALSVYPIPCPPTHFSGILIKLTCCIQPTLHHSSNSTVYFVLILNKLVLNKFPLSINLFTQFLVYVPLLCPLSSPFPSILIKLTCCVKPSLHHSSNPTVYFCPHFQPVDTQYIFH